MASHATVGWWWSIYWHTKMKHCRIEVWRPCNILNHLWTTLIIAGVLPRILVLWGIIMTFVDGSLPKLLIPEWVHYETIIPYKWFHSLYTWNASWMSATEMFIFNHCFYFRLISLYLRHETGVLRKMRSQPMWSFYKIDIPQEICGILIMVKHWLKDPRNCITDYLFVDHRIE